MCICVYVYVCAPMCRNLCVTRESNFVRYFLVYSPEFLYKLFTTHRVFITYYLYINDAAVNIIINVNYYNYNYYKIIRAYIVLSFLSSIVQKQRMPSKF